MGLGYVISELVNKDTNTRSIIKRKKNITLVSKRSCFSCYIPILTQQLCSGNW